MGKKADAHALQERLASIKSRIVHDGKYLKVRQDIIESPGHPSKTWDIGVNPGAVAVIPINSEGNLVLVEQWRRAIGRITLELPAGMLDSGESPETCAQRELQEEAGYKAGSLIAFGGCYTSPGTFTEYIHLYIGQDLTESPLHADDTDGIDVCVVTFDEALKLIKRGDISDAKTVIGILRYVNKC